jgi:hypothetical protein
VSLMYEIQVSRPGHTDECSLLTHIIRLSGREQEHCKYENFLASGTFLITLKYADRFTLHNATDETGEYSWGKLHNVNRKLEVFHNQNAL